jgi:hypothetical protein
VGWPGVDGSELARRIFTSQAWSVGFGAYLLVAHNWATIGHATTATSKYTIRCSMWSCKTGSRLRGSERASVVGG